MTHLRTAIEWEREYDARPNDEHRSVVERARDALRRSNLDPFDPAWRLLVHEFAVEISAAENVMLKNSLAFMREALARELPK